MTRKLGMRPADPARLANARRMARFLDTSQLPSHPTGVDYMARVPQWLLGRNKEFGTCGPTYVANYILLVTTWLAEWPLAFTDEEILDFYKRSGNPDFDPNTGEGDNGVDMTVMLSELVHNGIGFGARNVKALAYAAIDSHNTDLMWSAAARFGGLGWGSDLAQAQDKQTDARLWDYVARSRPWGGHATLSAPRYSDVSGTTADRTGLVTWAEVVDATDAFIGKQVAECYIVVLPWHLQDKTFLENTDLATLARDFTEITGKPFPVVVPQPVPEPVPEPPVDPPAPADADRKLAAAFDAWRTEKGV
jgi:hypothetical protein